VFVCTFYFNFATIYGEIKTYIKMPNICIIVFRGKHVLSFVMWPT